MADQNRDDQLNNGLPLSEEEQNTAPQGEEVPEEEGATSAPESYAAPEGYVPPEGYAAPEGYAPPESYAAPEGYVPPEGYAAPSEGESEPTVFAEQGESPLAVGDDSSAKAEHEKPAYASKGERQTFAVRMGDAGYVTGRRYDAIKNAFLSYRSSGKKPKAVRARLTSGGETFGTGKKLYAKLCLVGGYLRLFLALDPKAYNPQKYHHKDYTEVVRYAKVPLMIKLSSDRQVKNALELIDDVLTQNGFVKDETYVPEDQAYIFKKSRKKKTKIVYVEKEGGPVAVVPDPNAGGAVRAELAPADYAAEEEAELVAIDVKLPKRAGVYNREGNKIGKVRKSVWYDLEDNSVGTFKKEEENVFLYDNGARAAYVDQNNNVLTLGDKYVATIRFFRWLPLLLLIIILALATAFSVILSAYLMGRSGPADYAPTLFIAHEDGTEWNESEDLPVFANDQFDEQAIAPGMNGSYRFTFENRNQHALDFSISFSEENEYDIELVYRLKRDGAYIAGAAGDGGWVELEDLSVSDMTIEESSSTIFEIEWYWRHNDPVDTEAGENAATYTLHIALSAAVRQ